SGLDRLVGKLGLAEVPLEGDGEALRLERLSVELFEDVALAEALRADDDRRLRPRRRGRRRGGAATTAASAGGEADEKRDSEGNRERRLGSTACVLAKHPLPPLWLCPLRACPRKTLR